VSRSSGSHGLDQAVTQELSPCGLASVCSPRAPSDPALCRLDPQGLPGGRLALVRSLELIPSRTGSCSTQDLILLRARLSGLGPQRPPWSTGQHWSTGIYRYTYTPMCTYMRLRIADMDPLDPASEPTLPWPKASPGPRDHHTTIPPTLTGGP